MIHLSKSFTGGCVKSGVFSGKRNGTTVNIRKASSQKYARFLWEYSIKRKKQGHSKLDILVEDGREKEGLMIDPGFAFEKNKKRK